jgi:DNA recombination protein RmuC
MNNDVFLLLAGFGGIFVGTVATQLVFRSKMLTAEIKTSAELATLHEQLKRANAIDAEYDALKKALALKQDDLIKTTTQLNERSNTLENLEKNYKQAENDAKLLQAKRDELQKESNTLLSDLRQKLGVAESALAEQREQCALLKSEKNEISEKRDNSLIEQQNLSSKVGDLTAKLDAEQKQGAEKIALLNDAKEQLSDKFKTLATEILEEKSKRFAEQNQTNLGQLLEPLKHQLQDFKGKVEEVYIQEGKERSALTEQLKTMMSLNQQLSKDADNLTRALKGDNKAQGNWGELMLERILETSGLRKGHEYDVQESYKTEEGSRLQPDVVIHLPEDKHLVVDSKVSIVAYSDYIAADSDGVKNAALKRHIDSFKMHIKGLSEKKYQQIHGVKSLDFVLMFVPVESAFMLAIANDDELWQEAWKKNVLLVSPSTLLFVVRTVAHLWKQEQQGRNAQEIAKRGADLYDKIVGFVADMNDLGNRLKQANDSYDKAFNKLSKGRGNVMRQAEMLKDLGVRPTKQLNIEQLDEAEGN